MKLPNRPFNCLPFILCATILSCDSFREDYIRDTGEPVRTHTDYYTFRGSSLIIDLGAVVARSFSATTLTILEQPARGTLTRLDSRLLNYHPGLHFTDGVDKIVIQEQSTTGTLYHHTIQVNMKQSKDDPPCRLFAVTDSVQVKAGESVSISVTGNDVLCGVHMPNMELSVALPPLYGEARIEGNNIHYTAGPEYRRNDKFIYRIAASNGEVSYGITLLSEGKMWPDEEIMPGEQHVEFITIPKPYPTARNFRTVEFIDRNVGFIAGPGIFKTVDGGATWRPVFASGEQDDKIFIDIQFLNPRDGFAIYNCDYGKSAQCQNGLAVTQDGGDSWIALQATLLDNLYVMNVSFTNTLKGFVQGFAYWGLPGYPYERDQVLLTEDGGLTWQSVLITDPGTVGFGFTNDNVGYAMLYTNNILKTEDGGDTWSTLPIQHDGMTSAGAVYSQDTIFVCRSDQGSQTTSSIVRCVNNVEEQVANLPYPIQLMKFSPARRVGVAVGIYRELPDGWELAIHRTTNKGAAWPEETVFKVTPDYWPDPGFGPTNDISVTTDHAVYILWANRLIRYSN